MNYKATLKSGAEVLLQNDGEQTRVQLQSGDSSNQQSQGTSFNTGKWSQTPRLLETGKGAILQVEAGKDPVFFALSKDGIDRLDAAPDFEGATPIELQESDEASAPPQMDPMKPMEPMKPMKPMS